MNTGLCVARSALTLIINQFTRAFQALLSDDELSAMIWPDSANTGLETDRYSDREGEGLIRY